MLTSKQRAILRGKANTMDPVYIVGKGEIDETLSPGRQGLSGCPGTHQAQGAGK